MKSKTSDTANLSWDSSIHLLAKSKKPTKFIENLTQVGVLNLKDLLNIHPLRIFKTPQLSNFNKISIDDYLRGQGTILHKDIKPAFGRKTKGRFLLYNGYMVLQDNFSPETLILRWFNLYPNQKKQLEEQTSLHFLGQVQIFNGQKQIVNPQILQAETILHNYIIEYPTINKVSGNYIHKLIDCIPFHLWDKIPEKFGLKFNDQKISRAKAYQIIHGKIPVDLFSISLKDRAEEKLIYDEFVESHLKVLTRKKYLKSKVAPQLLIDESQVSALVSKLPFQLTPDQIKVLQEIFSDLKLGKPMMRMIQGDVGCGKTVVALITSIITCQNKLQVAFMCPTEALAIQQYENFKLFAPNLNIKLLLGSTKLKEKRELMEDLKKGVIHILLGTHSLIQESVIFNKLGLAIIDEQHKFGVEQRLKLVSKGSGVHSLIMSATPIPRTLSLIQYGDLDLSVIKTMPQGRIPIKTRITELRNYDKYLSFIKSRLSLGDQAYFVFPAIEENEILEIQNVKASFEKYKLLFNPYQVGILHGQMKSDEKNKTIQNFKDNKIQILISTSVIEVGINIPNATIMSIYNPERFGLSSLHQLRGRVGRGDKPGFCFLVLDKELGQESMERLRVIENTLDGFIIAEEDLKFRGEGDLFGVHQSGSSSGKRLANFIQHQDIFLSVVNEINTIFESRPDLIIPDLEMLAKDQKILDTI